MYILIALSNKHLLKFSLFLMGSSFVFTFTVSVTSSFLFPFGSYQIVPINFEIKNAQLLIG